MQEKTLVFKQREYQTSYFDPLITSLQACDININVNVNVNVKYF